MNEFYKTKEFYEYIRTLIYKVFNKEFGSLKNIDIEIEILQSDKSNDLFKRNAFGMPYAFVIKCDIAYKNFLRDRRFIYLGCLQNPVVDDYGAMYTMYTETTIPLLLREYINEDAWVII